MTDNPPSIPAAPKTDSGNRPYPEGWWRKERPEGEWVFFEDFRAYLWAVWDHLRLPIPTDIQQDIAQYLQYGPRRRMIMAFRGVGKSWISSAYTVWLLMRDPNHKVLVVSASQGRADAFSIFTKRIISEMPMCRWLMPREGQRMSSVAFDVGPAMADHSPSVKSVGMTGQMAGSRADTIIPDDVEVPSNSLTVHMRDQLREGVKEFDAILKPGGQVCYLGTPQTNDSIYSDLPGRGYDIRIWTARIPENVGVYGVHLAPFIKKLIEAGAKPGDVTDPKRFTHDDLTERELSYGRSGFQLQFMLNTAASDADKHPLKLKDLIVYPCRGDQGPVDIQWGADKRTLQASLSSVGLRGDYFYGPIHTSADENHGFSRWDSTIMWIDPSGRGKDETAVVILRHLAGRLFLCYVGGFLGHGYDETEVLLPIRKLANQYGVTYIGVESNYGDGMFEKLLSSALRRPDPHEREWKGVIEGHRVHGQKEARIIDTLEPIMNQHRLVVDPQVVEEDLKAHEGAAIDRDRRPQYMLFHQMTRIHAMKGALRHDDRIDCLAQAVHYFTESMARETSANLKKNQEAEIRRGMINGILDPSVTQDIRYTIQGTDEQGRMRLLEKGRGGSKWKRRNPLLPEMRPSDIRMGVHRSLRGGRRVT